MTLKVRCNEPGCTCGLVLPVVKRADGWVGPGLPWEEPTDLTDEEALAWIDATEPPPLLVVSDTTKESVNNT